MAKKSLRLQVGSCKNLDCCARFVYRAYYSHILQPPAATLTDSLTENLAQLSPQARAEVLRPYQHELNLFPRNEKNSGA